MRGEAIEDEFVAQAGINFLRAKSDASAGQILHNIAVTRRIVADAASVGAVNHAVGIQFPQAHAQGARGGHKPVAGMGVHLDEVFERDDFGPASVRTEAALGVEHRKHRRIRRVSHPIGIIPTSGFMGGARRGGTAAQEHRRANQHGHPFVLDIPIHFHLANPLNMRTQNLYEHFPLRCTASTHLKKFKTHGTRSR